MESDTPVMLAVDANSLLHRSYHAMASSGLTSPDGTPSWAIKGMWSQILAATSRTGASALLLAFDSTQSFRRESYEHYKANRADKDDALRAQLDAAPDHFAAAGVSVVSSPGFEADDLLASTAALNATTGRFRTVVFSSDRDVFALADENTSVLRLLNGGVDASPLLTPDKVRLTVGVAPQDYRFFAAMRGDTSDNLPGARGVGPKTALAVIEAMHACGVSVSDVLDDPAVLYGQPGVTKGVVSKLSDVDSVASVRRNLDLMRMRTDVRLRPSCHPGLPIDSVALRTELESWGMVSLVEPAVQTLS